jgi:signal transduction histidine kinase
MNINESIFAKLIVLIVLYGFLINIAVVLFLNYNQDPDSIHQNRKILSKMEEILAQELGVPPDSTTAKKIFHDYNINIQYKYKDTSWSTSAFIPTIEEISRYNEFLVNNKDTNYFSFYHKDKIYGVTKIPDGIIILTYYYDPSEIFDLEKIILAIVIHLSLFFAPLYFLIKWLLNPIKPLTYAVKQIGDGNFDVELNVDRDDEFGELAKSLKNMTSRVKDSISAKEQLLMDISHELRTPLTRIKFGLELGSPKEKINDDVTEIENMIKKTLEYYRNEFFFLEANLSETNVIPLLENVISSFDIQLIRIVFYNFAKNKNKIIIRADEEKLTIALRNLISNALKYSPADKNILVSVDESEKYYKIGVRDFGVGMKKEDMHKIFEPFSRIDSSRSKKTGGYGLGLAIVKKIVDLHNAFIEVKSEENKGTEMIIKFKKLYY